MIDDQGVNIGVITKQEALNLAGEKGMDLIEISPTANPPIAKIINFDKFRYQQEKEEKRQQAQQRSSVGEVKQIRISVRAAENDLRIKAKHLDEFIEKGNNVEIMLALRGREKYNEEWIRQRLDLFLGMITVEYKIISPQKKGGRGITMQIGKK